jgi:hypothetical protein
LERKREEEKNNQRSRNWNTPPTPSFIASLNLSKPLSFIFHHLKPSSNKNTQKITKHTHTHKKQNRKEKKIIKSPLPFLNHHSLYQIITKHQTESQIKTKLQSIKIHTNITKQTETQSQNQTNPQTQITKKETETKKERRTRVKETQSPPYGSGDRRTGNGTVRTVRERGESRERASG